MGKVLGAVAAGVLTVATGGTFLGFTGLTAGLLSAASSLVLSGLASALAPKPKAMDFNSSTSLSSLTRQIRQPINSRRTVYGEMRVSGPYAFIGSTSSNEYLHFILMLASHEVHDIGEVWFNDDSITPDMIDSNGDVISGPFAGYARITKMMGTTTQGAEPNMMSSFSEWTSDHRLQGIAYLYVRLKYNRDVFAGGIPNVSTWIRGQKLYDQRVNLTRWHHNPALMQQEYITNEEYGRRADQSKIDEDYVIAGANNCEEFVTTQNITTAVTAVGVSNDIISLAGDTLQYQRGDRVTVQSTGTIPGGITNSSTNYYVIPYQRKGTPRIKLATTYENSLFDIAVNLTSAGTGTITIVKNAEPRYTAGGVADWAQQPQEIMNDIAQAMAGDTVYSGGKWRILTGRYETPTIAYDEDDFAGPIIVKTKLSRRERFNRVIGTYVSPLNNGQPSDYPYVKNDTYLAQDMGVLLDRQIDQKYVQRPHQAQRIAKIELEKGRQEITAIAQFKLSAFKSQVGDNILLSFARYGWSDKVFRVEEWALQIKMDKGVPVPYIEMSLREMASTVFDWNNGEETSVDPAPNTTLPNVRDISAVSGMSFDSLALDTLAADKIYKIILGWDLHPDAFVREGGQYEIQYKTSYDGDGNPTTDADYKPSFFVDGVVTESEIATASAGVEYDIRIRAVNNVGVRSPWNYLYNVVTGTGGGVTDSEDWGNFTTSPTFEDWGDFAPGPTTGDEDYGAYV